MSKTFSKTTIAWMVLFSFRDLLEKNGMKELSIEMDFWMYINKSIQCPLIFHPWDRLPKMISSKFIGYLLYFMVYVCS